MAAVKNKKTSPKKSRVRQLPSHRSFRLTKKRLKQPAALPSGFKLLKDTSNVLRHNKLIFGGITLVYALLSLIFVQGFGASFDLVEVKASLGEIIGGASGNIATSLALFGYMVSTAGAGAGESSAAYQFFLALIASLAAIWAVRQIQAGERPRVRDTFYRGMYPLVPFVLVLMVIALQFLPLLIGNLIYSTIVQNGLAVSSAEQALWLLLFLGLALLSLYMVLSSMFALYIVTLPDMTPLKALRSARELVLHRRFSVALRVIVLPIVLCLILLALFMPLLLFATSLAPVLFIFAVSASLVVWHAYMYLLYRTLL